MNDKEKIFGSPSDYPFSQGNANKTEMKKRIEKENPTRRKRKGNGFQRQIKRTKYRIAKRIVGGL